MGCEQSDQDFINLQFVRQYTNIAVPELVVVDTTSKNPLGQPFMIQKRIAGHDLESAAQDYSSLTHIQKVHFVKEFCQVLLDMQKVQHPWAGQIVKIKEGESEIFGVGPFEVFHEDADLIHDRAEILPFFKTRPFIEEITPDEDADDEFSDQSVLHFLEVQFARWSDRARSTGPSKIWRPTIWHQLVTMAQQIDEVGCLDGDSYCLTP